jgi:glutamine synthetase
MDKKEIQDKIKEFGIDTLRIDFPDMYGINRGKICPANRLEEVLEEGINCAKPTFSLDLAYNIPPGTGTADEVNYEDMTIIPDPDTFTVVPYLNNTARFIGDIYANGKPFPYSPRGLLKKVLKKFEEKNLSPVAATELEFYIFSKDGDAFQFYCDKPSNVYTTGPRIDPLDFLRRLQNFLIEMGFNVLYLNHEFFQGQYEINWRHTTALKMADQAFTFKTACKEFGFMNDLHITFMGRPRDEMGGSGNHLHFSIEDPATGENLFYDPNGKEQMSDLMRQCIAGQMAHAKGMSLFLAPTINSYKRYVLNNFAPYYIAWGLDNRTTYIRIPRERKGGTRIENRAPCGSANPYLALAVGLIACLDGIENKMDPGDYYVGDIYTEEPGTYPVMPLYMRDAIEALEKDELLCNAVGPEITQNYLAVKKNEEERYRTAITDWEFNEYFYHL